MGTSTGQRIGTVRRVAPAFAALAWLSVSAAWAQTPLPTTINDFFLRGTQPNALTNNILTHNQCINCHNNTGGDITKHWQGSIMAQAGRDPLFYACLEVAEHITPGSGDLCIRCHTPKGWLEGRSTPTSGSALTAADRDAINCNFCHRMVDPANPPGEPAGDAAILAALVDGPPISPGNGSFVVDPTDLRRGPFTDAQCAPFHNFAASPFYQKSAMCGTCHDVSNPAFTRQMDDTYAPNSFGDRHPTGNKYDMRPVERTYSEWLNSEYATPPGVDAAGRFGGPGQTFVSSCQDCHMPDTTARGCNYPNAPLRTNMPRHHLNGAATWVLDAVKAKYGASGTGELTAAQEQAITDSKARNIDMLQRAATMQVSLVPGGSQIRVRVINETGHKLPSGYPEGRRIWLNVKFRDCQNNVLAERGAYDAGTATLTTNDTKVYEIEAGIDSTVAAATNLPAGHTFFFTINNVVLKDNRIPPRGFTNAAFTAAQTAPVNYSYPDGQYWDDTLYNVPAHAATAEVELFYQTSSKDYIEFLRDHNPNTPPNRGTELYDLWVGAGKGAPVSMAASGAVNITIPGDVDGDRAVTVDDIPPFVAVLLGLDGDALRRCAADVDGIAGADGRDVQTFVGLLLGS